MPIFSQRSPIPWWLPVSGLLRFLQNVDPPYGLGPRLPSPAGWWHQLGAAATSRLWTARAPAWGVPLVDAATRSTGVPGALLAALIRTESAWQPKVISSAGAIGLAQLMPATAAELGVEDAMDPAQNIMGGARYLRAQLDRFDDVRLALAAYNAGPHRVVQYRGVPPYKETQAYVEKVISRL